MAFGYLSIAAITAGEVYANSIQSLIFLIGLLKTHIRSVPTDMPVKLATKSKGSVSL